MARLILIDAHSGYVFADTADLPEHTLHGDDWPITKSDITADDEGMILACRWHDEAVAREFGRGYEVISASEVAGADGYHVYRADVDGSEAVHVAADGTDPDYIAAVERDCAYLGFVKTTPAA